MVKKSAVKSSKSWFKVAVAAVSAAAVAGVVVTAPLSVPQAAADPEAYKQQPWIDQELLAANSEGSTFDLESLEVNKIEVVEEKKAEPEKTTESATGQTATTASAPPVGEPDPGSAQAVARSYVTDGNEYACLVKLWNRESNWNVYAHNASSGAYGIPQSLPGSKMASEGADWQTNPDTQIRWGLKYIAGRYGTPCSALAHSDSRGWY